MTVGRIEAGGKARLKRRGIRVAAAGRQSSPSVGLSTVERESTGTFGKAAAQLGLSGGIAALRTGDKGGGSPEDRRITYEDDPISPVVRVIDDLEEADAERRPATGGQKRLAETI